MTPRDRTLSVLVGRFVELTPELVRRCEDDFVKWLNDLYEDEHQDVLADPEWLREEVGTWAEDVLSVHVRDDGRVEVWTLPDHLRRFLRDLPLVLFHHTSSTLLPAIRMRGLRPRRGRGTRWNSRAGVYLTSEVSGPVVDGYHHRAVQRFGGDRVSLEVVIDDVRDLRPDPDDQDLASGRTQWVVPYVLPEKVLWDD